MVGLIPEILHSYFLLFRPHFTKPSFVYFSGYILSLLLTGGRKTMSRVAHTCFFVDRHLASWERFLAENRWDPIAVFGTLLESLRAKLNDSLQVHGDAFFSKAPFVNPLLEKGIPVVSKLRHDAVGWDDPRPEQRADARRGQKWKLAHLLTHLPAEAVSVHLYGKIVTVQAACRQVWLRGFNLKEETSAWLPPVPKGVSPASFAHLRQGLQRFIFGRILSPQFGEIPNLKANTSELEAILRIAA